MILKSTVRSLSLLSLCVLAACAPFGKQSPLEQPTAYSLPQGQSTNLARANWWLQLNDSKLNGLINQALESSPSLQSIQARFQQAQAQLGITEALDKTQISLAAKGFGAYVTPKPNSQVGNSNHFLDVANLGLQAHWSFDFWGKNKAQIASVIGKRDALAYENAQAKIEIAQAVSAQYFAWQNVVAQQAILQQRIANAKQSETLLQQRVRAQLLPASAVYAMQQAQVQMQVQQVALEKTAARLRHSLAVLTGQGPNALDSMSPSPMSSVPVINAHNVRADLIGSRPDIAAQRALLESASQNIKATKAEFYPNIELTALAGLTHIDAFNILKGKNSTMLGIMPALNLPLFTSGALQAKLAMSNAQYNQQVAQYNQTVVDSMRAAADSVSDYQNLRTQAALQQKIVSTSAKTAAATLRRVNAGLENKLTYLQNQDAVLVNKAQSFDLQSSLLTAWSNLNAQLGGGFYAKAN